VQEHEPRTHEPVQQSPFTLQLEPTMLHVGVPLWQRAGSPAHVPAQHSSLVVHARPAPMHDDVQTGIPASSAAQVPSQQVSPVAHGAPRGKHAPEPNAHREVAGSQLPEQQGGTLSLAQVSPVERQTEGARLQIPAGMPGMIAQTPEQQSPSTVHGSPAIAQSAGPQTPSSQPREQQSVASLHAVPFTRQ
jgi:hypothetical protein